MGARVEYGQRVSPYRSVVQRYWFDVLIAALVVAAMLEVVTADSANSPTKSLWFAVPAIGILGAPIFFRRSFPFAAPAAYWVLAAAVAFVNWRLVPYPESLFPVGLAAAFLLGNLRNALQAAIGLVVVVCGMALLVNEIHGHSTAELIFLPLDFAIAIICLALLAGVAATEAKSLEPRA